MVRCILKRSFAERGVAFKTRNRSEKESEEEKSMGKRKEKAKTRHEPWEREARKVKKAGKTKRHKKKEKSSLFIQNVSKTYCVYIQYFWEYALFRKTIGRIY